MSRKFQTVLTAFLVLFLAVGPLSAANGTLDPTTPPDSTPSYTLEDIYNRLNAGVAGTETVFTEPSVGPSVATMHTLNEIMAKAPALDDTNGATAGKVLAGNSFWGLTAGEWGLKTGTMADNGAVVLTPGTSSVAIAAGYHNGSGYVVGDTNLAAGNIISGVSIFGVGGSVIQATGNAAAANVLTGTTFSNVTAAGLTGTMADNGAVVLTPGTSSKAIVAGYHNGAGYVVGDANLAAGNIISGVSIFGVGGSVIQATGNAAAGNVLTGTTFSNATAADIAGAMADNGAVRITPGTSDKPIAAGYHNGLGIVAGDTNLAAGNIISGVSIFGVTGIYPLGAVIRATGQTTSTGHGAAWPSPRFTDNGDGTTKDNLTELIWLKEANCPGGARTWAEASGDVAKLNENGTMNSNDCGLTGNPKPQGWRLPSIRELSSLLDYGYVNPALSDAAGTGQWKPGDAFSNVQLANRWYWSETPLAIDAGWAWAVAPDFGYVGVLSGTLATGTNPPLGTYYVYVWPVRNGQ